MAVKKEQPLTKYYELVEKKSSGFIMNGTKGTMYQQELNTPSVRWIPTKGRTVIEGEKGAKVYKEITYISGCDTLDPEEQKKRGIIARPFEDKIPMENGFMTVVRDGNTISLYDYLEAASYNLDFPLRSKDATAIYREVKLDKKAEVLLDEDEVLTQAKSLVYQLRINTGDKKTPYKYNSDRIDAICRMVNVWDETPERKLILLLQTATQNPAKFLKVVVKSEQTVITEVSHALELNVIKFDKTMVFFTEGDKIFWTLPNEKMKADEKIEAVAAWLSTEDGTPTLTEMRGKLEIAKGK